MTTNKYIQDIFNVINFLKLIQPYSNISYNLAIKNLKKSIPKSPVIDKDEEFIWECPTCRNFSPINQKYDYCPKCGQKIMWWDNGGIPSISDE